MLLQGERPAEVYRLTTGILRKRRLTTFDISSLSFDTGYLEGLDVISVTFTQIARFLNSIL